MFVCQVSEFRKSCQRHHWPPTGDTGSVEGVINLVRIRQDIEDIRQRELLTGPPLDDSEEGSAASSRRNSITGAYDFVWLLYLSFEWALTDSNIFRFCVCTCNSGLVEPTLHSAPSILWTTVFVSGVPGVFFLLFCSSLVLWFLMILPIFGIQLVWAFKDQGMHPTLNWKTHEIINHITLQRWIQKM